VGQENHTEGHPFRFGVWVDGQFRWVSDDGGSAESGWARELAYVEETLVTHVTLRHPGLALRLVCRDAVDFHIGGDEVGGLARYEDDYYHQVSNDVENVPSNRWFTCTLWLAQWSIAKAQTFEGLKPALELLDWVAARDLQSGVMAEQVRPDTNEPLSVGPLTWSHATLGDDCGGAPGQANASAPLSGVWSTYGLGRERGSSLGRAYYHSPRALPR
jgi:hypothetical protein